MLILSTWYRRGMSQLKVYTFPDPVLREKSKPVKQITSSIEELVKSMFETMVVENGIGLAAPQVGEKLRVIVLDVPIVDPDDPDNDKKRRPDPVAMINPEIISGEGLIQFEEGCLSCPEIAVFVDRQEQIRVKYLDVSGRPLTLEAAGLKAVCIQHEIDHLNGVLLVDRLSRLKRDIYRKQRIRILRDEKDAENIL